MLVEKNLAYGKAFVSDGDACGRDGGRRDGVFAG